MDDDIAIYFGQKGYTIYKENLEIKEQELIRKELTVSPYVPKNSLQKPTSFPIYRESPKKMYLPKYYGYKEYGDPDEIRLKDGEDINTSFNGELRDFQKPIVKTYLESAKKCGGGLLEIHTGSGKTVMGLNIISHLKKKTLIIVHKEFLLRQWLERIEQFLPNARVGKIQGKVIDVENKDIVIGMLQSLSMKEYPQKLFEQFGLSIYDECHHISAEVFSRVLFKVVTKYTLGLSATMKRKDGLTKVIKMFLGEVVYKKERKGCDYVKVKSIHYQIDDDEYNKVLLNWKGQTHYSRMIKKICEYNKRSEFILKIISDIIKNDEENNCQIMILAHNKSILKYLHDAIKYRNLESVGYYVGGMKEKDLKISEKKKVIIATYAMAEEGLDIKSLTTLIMATPRVNVAQAVGRILREKHENAEVYDIVDSHDMFQRHWTKRRAFYKKQNFKIYKTTNKDYENDKWECIYDKSNGILKKNKKYKNSKQKKVIKINTSTQTNLSIDNLLNGVCLIDFKN
jgi:superfamily II DNA or RNA helicase